MQWIRAIDSLIQPICSTLNTYNIVAQCTYLLFEDTRGESMYLVELNTKVCVALTCLSCI